MTEERTQQRGPESRMSYLRALSEEARIPFDDTLTREQASKRIDELQGITGRGLAQEDPERQRVETEEVEVKK